MLLLTELSVDLVVYHFQVLEGLRVDSWHSGDSIDCFDMWAVYIPYVWMVLITVGFAVYTYGLRVPWAESLWATAGHTRIWGVKRAFLLGVLEPGQSMVEGIQGIMMAYTGGPFNVSLAGPTLFGPVISIAAQIAGQSLANNELKYFFLLIITFSNLTLYNKLSQDGVITDLQETKEALVKASDLPLSILIVGVGGADFKEMEILDTDKGERLESSNGHVASRDTVQFVPMRDVQSGEFSVVQSLLAELPSQFLTYMRTRVLNEHSNEQSLARPFYEMIFASLPSKLRHKEKMNNVTVVIYH
ncbi:hypothetical protein ACSBR2_023644 [Camellia fascicularis]